MNSWEWLRQHDDTIAALEWTFPEPTEAQSVADQFLRLACLNYTRDDSEHWTQAADLVSQHPELTATNLAVAAVCADVDAVRNQIDKANSPTGPYGWPPLMYLTYARIDTDLDATLAVARLLLEHGADPNAGRFFGGQPTPFTVLTGAFGGGEQGQPPHQHAIELARLLLSSGAEANDPQTLYNRMFTIEDDFLRLLFDYGLGRGDGGPWARLVPGIFPDPSSIVRGLLDWAVTHNQGGRVALLAANGVDVLGPLSSGRTPIEIAAANGHRELVAQLRGLGAPEPSLNAVDEFIAKALAGDSGGVAATPPDVIEAAIAQRPGLVTWAAAAGGLAAVELVVAAGFDVNAFGRGDVPIEQEWQSALHTAVERDDAILVRGLLALGADPTLKDRRFDATALDWCHQLNRTDLAALLGE